jgi:RNA polymerase sigma-70 factor, ECF subfamily
MNDSRVDSDEASANQTSPTLLEKARQKDSAAWERLVALYTPLVYYWCRLAGLRSPDAEEVGQEVFLAVAQGLSTFDHDREGASFRGWLRVITRREILDHAAPPGGVGIGGSSAQQRLTELPAFDLGEEDAASRDLEKNILYHRAIELLENCFEPKTRRAFWLLIGGRTAPEVAAELQTSLSMVYTAKSKVLRRLKDEFSGLLDTTPSGNPSRAG